MIYKIKNRLLFSILATLFFNALNGQTIEFKRPGLSLQFTAIEHTGTYHFPVNNKWFDPEVQYTLNNEQLNIYRDYLKKIIVINAQPDTLSVVSTAGIILKNALGKILARWSSLEKAKKAKKKGNKIKYIENTRLSGLKSGAIYLLTREDFVNSKTVEKLIEEQNDQQYSLGNELKVLETDDDAYFIKYINGAILIVGSNAASVLYGTFDLISKIEKQKPLEEIQKPASPLSKYRLANLWNGVNVNASETFLNDKKLFYNILNAGSEISEQFIYDKLAQMLSYYNINGIVLTGVYGIFNNKYTPMLTLFTKKMRQYGINTYLEINPSFADANKDLIIRFLEEHKTLIKGIVINSINIRDQSPSGGSATANSIADKGFDVIWRDEALRIEKDNDKVVYNNPETENINKDKIVVETINKNPGKFEDTYFGPAAIVDNKLIKSFVLHWWGKNPYVDYTFSDERSNIAFIIYFYTKEETQTIQFIDDKINSNKP